MYFVLSRAVACGTVDCTFVRTDAWLDFSRDLVSLWPKLVKGRSKCGDCSLVTTVRTPSFSKNRCPRPRSMWQPRFLRNSFDNKSGAPPGTTCTRSTPLTPAIPTGVWPESWFPVSHRYQNGRSCSSRAGPSACSGPIFV